MPDLTLTQSYHFDLPEELIAQDPVSPRDESRLLVLDRKSGEISDRRFSDVTDILKPSDLLIANNSKVIPARLVGKRVLDDGGQGGRVEFLLLKEIEPRVWEGMFHASAKHRPGVIFEIPNKGSGPCLRGELVQGASWSQSGTVIAKFDQDPVSPDWGRVPLPPYIRKKEDKPSDLDSYQTVYAKIQGSAAAPTAGLHFTPGLIASLKDWGVSWEEITLHVGLGTFRPVSSEKISDHVMHKEYYEIDPGFLEKLNAVQSRKIAVGTTSLRALESSYSLERSCFAKAQGDTDIFLYPGGREIKSIDGLITNFHLPGSTLLMLVSAFAGYDATMNAYAHAVKERYRFFSYGDAMMII